MKLPPLTKYLSTRKPWPITVVSKLALVSIYCMYRPLKTNKHWEHAASGIFVDGSWQVTAQQVAVRQVASRKMAAQQVAARQMAAQQVAAWQMAAHWLTTWSLWNYFSACIWLKCSESSNKSFKAWRLVKNGDSDER